ncbi:multicopper oxidase family protein [Micromonospora sp. NBC_01796]|uniref:multicopper oxidase family protein n=1 Tax=Micromonospora sp. NBC_01796 TaxID=2975987 RepID=UPI002DDB6B43|nr:multicopper oxidase domain-containing protein [Micromonospora sp. NBC_01796]WSA85566.1 multicopper oxidase domain-containing protein [Micromonospora sp. NBC_01796]
MVARRQLLAAGAAGGAALVIPAASRPASAYASVRSVSALNPTTIPKYVTDLVIPPVMPPLAQSGQHALDEYRIAVRQFQQQVLPPSYPKTTVWSYGSPGHGNTFSWPAYTVEAKVGRPVRITWANELVDDKGNFLPHLLTVDPTLHWANPGGGIEHRDHRPTFTSAPEAYKGPVPMITHLHGAHTTPENDGYPEAWYLPAARNIPDGYAPVGKFYDEFHETFARQHKAAWKAGSATFQYPNDQRATTLWYHDHTLGMTRLNIYAGPVGFYLLRGGPADVAPGVLPGPAPALNDPPGSRYYEIPLVIQDRTFNEDGSLSYPSVAAIDGFDGPYIPDSDVSPMFNQTFFAETIVVNGNTWPVLKVEPRRYRFRLLNACNSRFLVLRIAGDATARPAATAVPIWQIGSDGGFLPKAVRHEQLVIGNAERVDVVVDFTGIAEGTALYLVNEGPDHEFSGGTPGTDYAVANPATTGQVMKFLVGSLVAPDGSLPPEQLELPAFAPLGKESGTRQFSLNVQNSTVVPAAGTVAHLAGGVDAAGARQPLRWHDPIRDKPSLGATEIWEFRNFTPHAHPVHIHQVQFQVLGRGPDGQTPPDPSESGFKDTVVTLPGHLTRVKAKFDLPGRYVWHCHILEHEDNEMMLPFFVGQAPKGGAHTGDGGKDGTDPVLTAAGVTMLAAAAATGIVLTRRTPTGSSA